MRKRRSDTDQSEFSILALDDDPIMTATLQSYFRSSGYRVDIANDPVLAIEQIRNGSYDILLLDFLMTPLSGDQVVEQVRSFNSDIFIILLTGHKSMAPPIRTIRALEIQGYYEKSDRFDQLELLVESCIKAIRQMRTIRSYQQSLTDMANMMPEIYDLQDASQIGESIMSGVRRLWGAASVLLCIWGDGGDESRSLRMSEGDLFADLAADSPEQLEWQVRLRCDPEQLLVSGIRDSSGRSTGFLAVAMQQKPDPYKEQLFQIFVRQCAASIENVWLMGRVKDGYVEVVKALRLMVDAKDEYTRGHSDRVSYLAGMLAEALGEDKSTCERVRTAGLFHDVGKMAIADSILLSPDKLSDEEFRAIKKHSECGYSILSAIPSFREIAPIVRSHHERIDGKGYPDGLAGDEIPEEARIISIADAFDSMTSTRRYRPNMTTEEAIERLLEAKGTQLDADMVDRFLELVKERPNEMLNSDNAELFEEGRFLR